MCQTHHSGEYSRTEGERQTKKEDKREKEEEREGESERVREETYTALSAINNQRVVKTLQLVRQHLHRSKGSWDWQMHAATACMWSPSKSPSLIMCFVLPRFEPL